MPIKPTSTDPAIRLFAASKAHHWSADNVAGAVTVLERCRTWLAAEHATTLLEADRLALQLYINDRAANGTWKGKRLSPNTIIVEHRQLRAFYKWAAAGDDPLILRSPMGSVEAPKAVDPDPASMPVLSEAHYRDMLAACLRKRSTRDLRNDRAHARRDAAILAVMWATGGRRAEIAALRLCDVDWDAQTVHFAKTKGRGKTKSRDAYFDDEALEYLTRYIVVRGDHEGPLFESMRRHPGSKARTGITPSSLTSMIHRRAREAGLTDPDLDWAGPGFGAHAFRRAAATDWLEHGGAVRDLETHMGWKHDGRMAAHYTKGAEAKQAATEAKRIAAARRARPLRAVS